MENETKCNKLYRDLLKNHVATFDAHAGQPLSADEHIEMKELLKLSKENVESSPAEDVRIIGQVLTDGVTVDYPWDSSIAGDHIRALAVFHIDMTAATPSVQDSLPYPGYAPLLVDELVLEQFEG